MVMSNPCPSQLDLARMAAGTLADELFETVCRHVESCARCQESLSKVEVSPDQLVGILSRVTKEDLERARLAMEAESTADSELLEGMLESRLVANRRQPTLSPPCELGPYKIERIIGEGGMGEVYAGRHTRLDRPVALKVIRGFRQDDPVSHSHFLKEAASAGKLDHPNLVRAYDAWEADGTLYLALELLDGKPLQKLAAEGRIASVREVLDAAVDICRGLEHLHASGLVHRDVKPANVMRLQDGSIKLIDFGLAVTGSPGTPHEDAVAPIAGTKGYMAPEQADGSGQIDARTDIFGAGQVIRFLLRNVSNAGPTRGDGSEAGLGRNLDRIAERMCDPDPAKRYQSVRDVLDELEKLNEKPASSTDSSHNPSGRTWLLPLLVLAVPLLGIGAYWAVFGGDRRATVTVENRAPGDVLQVHDAQGQVQTFALDDTSTLRLPPGGYELFLKNPRSRQLTPGKLKLDVRDRTSVHIEVPSAGPHAPIKMVAIPAGSFVMGAAEGDSEAGQNELPRRKVTIEKPFQISAHEITVGQFREFVEATGYVTEAESSGKGGWVANENTSWGSQNPETTWTNPGYPLGEELPVTLVTYADAMAYCEWLSGREGKRHRLPTEAEWEYACRAGSEGPYAFPLETRDSHCWSLSNCRSEVRPHPVGTRQPNAWGLYDMEGNVREWCVDWYADDAYATPYESAPEGPSGGTLRTIRGGCFMDLNPFLRASHRGYLAPDQVVNNQGFRVVADGP